jgi:hypothetical protein
MHLYSYIFTYKKDFLIQPPTVHCRPGEGFETIFYWKQDKETNITASSRLNRLIYWGAQAEGQPVRMALPLKTMSAYRSVNLRYSHFV